MLLKITKSARQFGYVIWTQKTDSAIGALIEHKSTVSVIFNGLLIGEKTVDWTYHRISIGYKFTRALPSTVNTFRLNYCDGVLRVEAINA